MLDAIAGIDTALWDIRGKALGVRVCDLLGGPFSSELPAYISGLSGADNKARIAQATDYKARGFRAFKLFMDGEAGVLLRLHDELREKLGSDTQLMVDTLWRWSRPKPIGLAGSWMRARQLGSKHP